LKDILVFPGNTGTASLKFPLRLKFFPGRPILVRRTNTGQAHLTADKAERPFADYSLGTIILKL
jgi:hypothetical protein